MVLGVVCGRNMCRPRGICGRSRPRSASCPGSLSGFLTVCMPSPVPASSSPLSNAMAPGIQKALPQSPKVKPSTPQHTSARAGAQKKMPPLALAGEKKPLLTAKTIASLTPPQKRVELLGLRGWYLASLVLVYAMSVVTNLITYILKPTMLLYTNEQGWTSKEDTKFYTMLMVITSVLPIMLNPVVTKWVDARSSKEVFIFMPLLCALGLALMLVQNKWLYFTGMSLTSGILCLRAARQAWILGAVPAAHTSRATLTLAVSFPIGSLLGPLVAVGVSRCWPHADLVYSYTVAGGYAVILSRYTVVYLVCFLIMSAQVLLVSFIFKVPLPRSLVHVTGRGGLC